MDFKVANINSTFVFKKNNMQIYILNKKKHVLRKVLYNWSWIRIGTYDNELQASTAVKSQFRVGTWSTITAIHLVFFSRSHYEFIIVRATRVSFRRIRKEEREAPRGKICGSNGREAKRRRTMGTTTMTTRTTTTTTTWNGGGDGLLFCQRDRENRPGEPRRTERYPMPSSAANPHGCDVDMRDIGVPLPGFLCASADRPKPVYGTSPRSQIL